jgi:hypothetical protein
MFGQLLPIADDLPRAAVGIGERRVAAMKDRDVVAERFERRDDVRADETAAADKQDMHVRIVVLFAASWPIRRIGRR